MRRFRNWKCLNRHDKRYCNRRFRRLRKYRSFVGMISMLDALGIVDSIWRRDEFCFRQFYFDCYPGRTEFDAHEAYLRECARVSSKGPSRPRSDISVGPLAVNRERVQQLSLPL